MGIGMGLRSLAEDEAFFLFHVCCVVCVGCPFAGGDPVMEGGVVLAICVLLLTLVMFVVTTMSSRMSKATVGDPRDAPRDRPPSGLCPRELVDYLHRRGVSMLTEEEARRLLVGKIVAEMRSRHGDEGLGFQPDHDGRLPVRDGQAEEIRLAWLIDAVVGSIGMDAIFRGVAFSGVPQVQPVPRYRRPSVL
jgi:hypothetical protein